jgi:hypothetical protein
LYTRIRRQTTVVGAEGAVVVGVVQVPGAEGANPPAKRARYSLRLKDNSACPVAVPGAAQQLRRPLTAEHPRQSRANEQWTMQPKNLKFDIEVSENVDPRYRRYKASILKCNIVPDIEVHFPNFHIQVCNFDIGISGLVYRWSDLRYQRSAKFKMAAEPSTPRPPCNTRAASGSECKVLNGTLKKYTVRLCGMAASRKRVCTHLESY